MCYCTPAIRCICCGGPDCHPKNETVKNLSELALDQTRLNLFKSRSELRGNLDSLSNKTTDYAEHIQHLINTYSDLINRLEDAIIESREIGSGV